MSVLMEVAMGMQAKRLHIIVGSALSAGALLASAWLVAAADREHHAAAPHGATAARGDHAAAMPAIERDIAESMLRAYGH